ncbi:hypothetical protein D3C72_1564120 [compost metagenome]
MVQVLRTFLRFGQGRGIDTFDQSYFTRQIVNQSLGNPCRIDQQAIAARNGGQCRMDCRVIAHFNAIGLEHLAQRCIQLAGRNKEDRLFLANQCKGYEHRIVGDVTAPQVEQPGDIVEGGNEVPVGATFA